MRKDRGVIGLPILIGMLFGGLMSFFATQNHDMNSKIKELKGQNLRLTKGIISCNKDKKDIADYIRIFIPDYNENK